MNLRDAFPEDFTLFTALHGVNMVTSFHRSIAEAEARFGELAKAGQVDRGEIYAAGRYNTPVRVLRVRQQSR